LIGAGCFVEHRLGDQGARVERLREAQEIAHRGVAAAGRGATQGRVSSFRTPAPLGGVGLVYPIARSGTSSDSGSESVDVMPAGRKML
jgi:hypothetical protein